MTGRVVETATRWSASSPIHPRSKAASHQTQVTRGIFVASRFSASVQSERLLTCAAHERSRLFLATEIADSPSARDERSSQEALLVATLG